MAITYNIGGTIIQADGPLSESDLANLDKQLNGNGTGDESSGQGVSEAIANSVGRAIVSAAASPLNDAANWIEQKLADVTGSKTLAADAANDRSVAAQYYNQYMADHKAAVPSYHDINSAHDAALYAADKVGGLTPYALAALTGGIPAAAGLGAAEGGDQAAQAPNATPASVLAGAAIGGGTAALPVPFLRSGSSLIGGALRGAAGGAVQGAVTGASANIPAAVASGNPEDAVPSQDQIIDSAIGGALGLGVAGGVHGALSRLNSVGSPQDASAPDPQAGADQRLARRISDEAQSSGASLGNVTYGASGGAESVLESVHNSIAEDIKGVSAILKPDLDPAQAQTVDDLLNRTALQATLRDARNKRKGVASSDDIQQLQDAVGDSHEGQVLVDLVRQSNSVTNLFRQGMHGGVSKLTDLLNPFTRGGSENGSIGASIATSPITRLFELGHFVLNPAHSIPAGAAFAAGRGIDAITGRRSTVAKFVADNQGAQPLPLTGQSILAQRAAEAARLKAQATAAAQAQAADQARLQAREQGLRTQNRLDNNPGLGGFDRSIYDQTGIRPGDAVPGIFELFRTGKITPSEFHGFFDRPRDLMAGNAGNHIIDMLDQMARNGQLQRDPGWSPQASSSVNPPQVGNNPAYEAQAAGNQARVTAAQGRVAASSHSSSTKQAINDAIAAIGRSNNRQDAAHVRESLVRSLQDPDAQAYARQETDPLVAQIRHPTPEAAAKSQPLIPTVIRRGRGGRPVERQRLNLASTDRLLDAYQEAMPRGSLTGDVTRDGNPVTRLRAQLYKSRAGITKPAYDGAREPDQAYLNAVADFHDKAVHDPDDPAVKRSYDALAQETVSQFKSLGGLRVETWHGDGEPYRNSKEMMRDVAQNHHLWFLPTESAFGSNGEDIPHPMLAKTGLKTVDGHPLLVNDVFRIVHDYFGHTQHGFQFGPKGEYNAFREHAQMYSNAALPALAAETLAQNAWVNQGPHMRRPDGSVPQQGEPGFVPAPKRLFSDQKAYAFPPELIARDPNLAREFVDHLYDSPTGRIATGADFSGRSRLNLHDAIPGFKGIAPFLTPREMELVTRRAAGHLVDLFQNLPPAAEMASVAYSGRAKRGWYRRSAKAIVSIFGADDAPRFTALLAALSPQISVEGNLTNALNVWRGWIEADRPTDERSIMRILGENVEGDHGLGSVLPSWIPNSLRAMTAQDGEMPRISGAKVSSFAANLMGEVNEVTNDTWTANYAAIDANKWLKWSPSGDADQFGNIAKKSVGYLAMNALTRKAASILTKRMGEEWTPAEVQETVWSWTKALAEKASSRQSAVGIVKQGDLSHDEINAVPDFEKLFVRDTYSRILDLAGYGDNIDGLKYDLEERSAGAGSNGPGGSPFSAEGSGVSQAALLKHLTASAARLDQLKPGGAIPRRASHAADLVIERDPSKFASESAKWAAWGRQTVVEDGKLILKSPVYAEPPPTVFRSVDRETSPLPSARAYTDPEGRQGAASFIAGMREPDGTLRGLSEPEIRRVAKTIATLVEDTHAGGDNGIYKHGANSIHIARGLEPDVHARVLGHETGHAVEALAGVAKELGVTREQDPAKGLQIVKELSDVSRLERPHLWNDAELSQRFGIQASHVPEYRMRLDELFADGFRHYMTNPASFKKVAPLAAQFMRDLVNPSKIGKVIAFTSLAGLTLPGIIAQALSFSSGGDQEDA